MNRTFKVVFSKVRGTMVVASEAAATPHKKAAKTVIAAAAALAMGTVMAQEWVDVPTADDGALVLEDNQSVKQEQLEGNSQFVYKRTDDTEPGGFYRVSEGESNVFDKKVWVTAEGAETRSHALHAQGQGVKLTNTGKIYIQAGTDAKSWRQKGMMAGNGAAVINAGQIVAKKAYGMTVEKNGEASHVINDVNGTITVLEEGAGIELGGASGSTAVNNGTITASSEGSAAADPWAHGVLIKAPVSGNSYKFTNNGEITANGPGASAIEVQAGDEGEVTSAEIDLIEGSQIDGVVRVDAGTKVTLNAKGTHDSFRLESSSEELSLNVRDGAEITLEDDDRTDNGALISSVVIYDGRLNASIWQQDNKFKDVTVNDGGTFNIKALNSKTSDDQAKNDRLLVAFGNNWTLNGGKLYVDGSERNDLKIKIGSAGDKGTGALTINSGNYSFGSVELGSGEGNSLTINGGTLTADTFNATYGTTTVSGGGVLASDNIEYTAGGNGTVKLSDGGTLRTSGKNIFIQSGEGEGASWGLSEFAQANFEQDGGDDEGILEITDGFTTSLDKLREAQKLLDGTTLYFSNVTLTDEEITFDENNGLTTANKEVSSNVASVDGKTTLQIGNTKNVGVGAIRVDAKTTDISIVGNNLETAGALLISGMPNGGNVITGVDSVKTLTTTGDIQLGLNAGSQGVVNADLVKADYVTVLGNFRLNDLEIGSLDVDQGAFLTINKLTGTGPASIEGGLSANVIATETTVENGGVLVIGERQAKESFVEEDGEQAGSEATQQLMLASVRTGDEPAAPTQPSEMVGQIQDVVHGAVGSVTTTNANGAAALVAAGFDSTKQAGLYIDDTIGVESTGTLFVGTGTVPEAGNGSVVLASDTFAVINVGELNGKAAFSATELRSAATIVLDNVTGLGTLTLLEGGTVDANYPASTIKTASALFDARFNEEDNKLIDIAYNKGVAGDIDSVVEGLVTNGTDVKNMNVLNALANKNNGFVGSDNKFTASGIQAAKEYLAAPVTAGTYNMAYDSMELISNALIQRNLDAKKGLGVWADVFYGSNESDSLYGDSGYSSDIYGGMLGVDFGFGEGARVGAALSIGSGDGDSEGSVSKYSTDSDFWGLSVYAGKDFGGLTFTGDMSYLWLDNDIGGSVAGASASESLDSTVFSLGVRADWKAYEGKVLQVVPHAGVRWASIDVDDYRGLSMDKMNVIEMPIGVTVKGVFETASGWQVAPEIDFTAAPQIGDTEVETIIGDVDVIDNIYNASIGVNAGTDAVRFGLSYKYGFGNDGRSNNTFNLKASYLF